MIVYFVVIFLINLTDNTGIHIVSIFKNSQAERDGVLREGDRVIEVILFKIVTND